MKPLILMAAAMLALGACSKSQDGANAASGGNAAPAGQGGRGQGLDRMFARMDTDGDGRISRDEYVAAQRDRFQRLDTNADGKISPDEMAAPPQWGGGGGGGGQGRADDPQARERRIERIKRMDTDGDGSVSAAEWEAASLADFKRMDANGDGYLTKDEMRAAWRNRGAGGSGAGGQVGDARPQG